MLAEACFLLARHRPALARLGFLVRNGGIRPVEEDERLWSRAFALMERYSNVPMSFADACLVASAEQREGARLFTLDGDFLIYRDGNGQPLPLIAPFEK